MRVEIADSISRLALHFPVGANSKRMSATVQVLEKWRKPLHDVASAVDWLIETRDTATFPTMAQILGAITEVRAARLRLKHEAKHADVEKQLRPMTEDERDQVRRVYELAKVGWYWCSRRGEFRGGDHVSAGQVPETLIVNVTREAIHAAHRRYVTAAL